MTITCNLYINGQWHDAEGRRTFTRRRPAHDEAASVAAAASLADGKRSVEAAACAFPLWRDTAPAERRRLLLEAAEQMLLREAKFIAAMAAETGATAHWAGFNVHLAADILREAAALTTQIEGQIIPSNVPGNLAMGVRQGAGVVLGMAPWNAPLILATRALATPLACGNTVILKGAELSPAAQGLIIDALDAAGFPPGVVNYLTCAPEDAPALVESLIAHPAVRRVNFTGSTPVGRIIARTCGQYLKPAVLELGGKAPLLVLDDADIEQAAAGAVFGAFANAGQICMSTERIIVDNAVAEAFIPLLARRAAALPAALTGPVVDMNTIARCNALIDDALAKGARLLTGGKANDTHMSPTLLDGVTREMRLWREESFGPVKAIIRVHSEEEALAVANDSEYGLSAAVYSRDSARAWNVAQRLQTGICHINGPTVHDEAQMPFGGCKASGYGRFGGRAGIAEFTELRWITIQTQPRELPF
ncbi:aldehyde dehydrogenase [Klebsiella pneumoniae]|uniref:aldehyde dehydrogenase n=1 Tax=Klebsiella pneumoniae TaxID=573 RepID=UPI001907D5DD|nr:aldehyde dehydrogenase [Klebsiella pneumoniae]MBK0569096.1 aldehyde dehydrogenase [Klebsiella pneumoniae]HBR5154068.1 aldehyde dehydrogenase [Klebsiella pneumoniae]